MLFTARLGQLALVLSNVLVASAGPSYSKSASSDNVDYKTLAQNYMSLWGGNMALIDSVIHPDVTLAGDRLPSPQGGSTLISITNREQYTAFIQKSRSGWKEYNFDILHTIGADNQMVVRWRMNGVTSANMTLPTTLPAGSSVAYNGTDYVVLDECTGLVKEVYMSQDFIAFFHALGLSSVYV